MTRLLVLLLAALPPACGQAGPAPMRGATPIPEAAAVSTSPPLVVADAPTLVGLPGQATDWQGYARFDFKVGATPVMVIAPVKPAPGNPWVWFGEFFDVTPALDEALLAKGFYLVHLDIPNMYGSPQAVARWDAVYSELVTRHHFAHSPTLVGYSRGTLYAYAWAARHPDKVSAIFGASSVCDFKSWPGGFGAEPRIATEWVQLLTEYGFKNDGEALAYKGNPVDSLAPLAAARIPLLHFYGDRDDVAPPAENTLLLADHYRQLGGEVTTVNLPGRGHNLYAEIDLTVVLDFVSGHTSVP